MKGRKENYVLFHPGAWKNLEGLPHPRGQFSAIPSMKLTRRANQSNEVATDISLALKFY
jgi:hypothetical protein